MAKRTISTEHLLAAFEAAGCDLVRCHELLKSIRDVVMEVNRTYSATGGDAKLAYSIILRSDELKQMLGFQLDSMGWVQLLRINPNDLPRSAQISPQGISNRFTRLPSSNPLKRRYKKFSPGRGRKPLKLEAIKGGKAKGNKITPIQVSA